MRQHGFMGMTDMHRECWDLLPWIVNERASVKDQARVEAHLRECAECQQELAHQRQLRDAVRAEEQVVLAPQTSLQKLMQRIDAEEAVAPVESVAGVADVPPPRTVTPWPRWLGVAAAVQGVAIALLIAALWLQARESLEAPRFTTLTSRAALPHGPVLRVVFTDGIALADVSSILRSIDAQIVAGPSEAGVYTLTLNTGSSHAASVDAALVRLRADDRVAFSEAAIAKSESK